MWKHSFPLQLFPLMSAALEKCLSRAWAITLLLCGIKWWLPSEKASTVFPPFIPFLFHRGTTSLCDPSNGYGFQLGHARKVPTTLTNLRRLAGFQLTNIKRVLGRWKCTKSLQVDKCQVESACKRQRINATSLSFFQRKMELRAELYKIQFVSGKTVATSGH